MKDYKVGSNAIEVPLNDHKIEFGVMKDILKYRYYEIIEKLEEEYEEVIETIEYNHSIDHKVEEIFDLMQVCFTYLKKLELNGTINIKKENEKHLNKLKKRGYIE